MEDAKGCYLARYSLHSVTQLLFTINIAQEDAAGSDPTGFSKMFADPNLLGRLATNPRTQKHLADPAFVQKVRVEIELENCRSLYILAPTHPA